MRAHYLQHAPFEGLGSIEAWLEHAGYEITSTQLYKSVGFPDLSVIDMLIIMGGPMSVNDEGKFPWLALEKTYIRNAIKAGVPTVGVCLGAQLIANSLGSKVFPNAEQEIGWYPIQPIGTADETSFQFPEEIKVFHWHGETFDLPPGAVRIASSRACRNQAFQIGTNVIGLQFHLETTSDSAQAIVSNCRDELVEGEFIQTEDQILAAPREQYEAINKLMGNVLDFVSGPNLPAQKG